MFKRVHGALRTGGPIRKGRTAVNGSFFNFYLCTFNANVTGLGLNIKYDTSVVGKDERCDLG